MYLSQNQISAQVRFDSDIIALYDYPKLDNRNKMWVKQTNIKM